MRTVVASLGFHGDGEMGVSGGRNLFNCSQHRGTPAPIYIVLAIFVLGILTSSVILTRWYMNLSLGSRAMGREYETIKDNARVQLQL